GRAVIITGASSGIGRETAREFARRRAHVVLASRNREKLEELAKELADFPGRRLVVPTDVTDRLAVEALIRRTVEEFDSVDVLVNNAGVGLFAPIAGGSLDNMHHLFNVNFWGAIQCIQATVPYMRRQQRGHIVNVSSIAGKVAGPYMGIYSATKFALAAVSDALRSELAGTGVHVSTVYPGLTETSFQENMLREVEVPDPPRYLRMVGASAVARRIVQAVRWSLRDAYVTAGDFAAVSAYPLAPGFADWAVRFFWLGAGTRPATADRAPSFQEPAEAPAGDPAEPNSETP
ncbi:MAG TPA: SDR family NAD(P)-dependent oxidoreductase, partial [Dehalococcoidia bacterium]|nr:SDR family NAD(P)-dependent oxidoreductase [Dehalococcoidia bacterium]